MDLLEVKKNFVVPLLRLKILMRTLIGVGKKHNFFMQRQRDVLGVTFSAVGIF